MLLLGAEVGLGRAARVGVGFERQVELHEVYAVAVFVHDLLQRRVKHATERTLEIDELDHVDLAGHVALANPCRQVARWTRRGPQQGCRHHERAERAPRPRLERPVRG
jgi:hypothetical protein